MSPDDRRLPESFIPLERMFDPHTFAYETGFVFRGVTVTPAPPKGWNVILRAWEGNQAVYAMTNCENVIEGLQALYWATTRKGGGTVWRADRYAR